MLDVAKDNHCQGQGDCGFQEVDKAIENIAINAPFSKKEVEHIVFMLSHNKNERDIHLSLKRDLGDIEITCNQIRNSPFIILSSED